MFRSPAAVRQQLGMPSACTRRLGHMQHAGKRVILATAVMIFGLVPCYDSGMFA